MFGTPRGLENTRPANNVQVFS